MGMAEGMGEGQKIEEPVEGTNLFNVGNSWANGDKWGEIGQNFKWGA